MGDDGLDQVRSALGRLQGLLASRRAYQALNEAASVDLPQQAAAVLEAVVDTDGASPARIAQLARMDPGAVSRQLRTLETAGLVERVDPVERKAQVQIRLGDSTHATYSEIHEALNPSGPEADSVRRLLSARSARSR